MTKEVLDRLLGNLQKYVGELKRLSELPKEKFLTNSDKIGNAKYNFVVAIECVIDIAQHLIAEYRLRRPDDYADTIQVLQEAGIVDFELSESLQSMVKFRNLLVHMYTKVEDENVYQYLKTNLQDFSDFAQRIAQEYA